MKYYTLTIVFDKERENVLMCFHEKQQMYNFIGGKVKDDEADEVASYRELLEETGITRDDIVLIPLRKEIVYPNKVLYDDDWSMCITFGVLNKDVTLREEANHLYWVGLNDSRIDVQSTGHGNCRVFLNEALAVMSEE